MLFVKHILEIFLSLLVSSQCFPSSFLASVPEDIALSMLAGTVAEPAHLVEAYAVEAQHALAGHTGLEIGS